MRAGDTCASRHATLAHLCKSRPTEDADVLLLQEGHFKKLIKMRYSINAFGVKSNPKNSFLHLVLVFDF